MGATHGPLRPDGIGRLCHFGFRRMMVLQSPHKEACKVFVARLPGTYEPGGLADGRSACRTAEESS